MLGVDDMARDRGFDGIRGFSKSLKVKKLFAKGTFDEEHPRASITAAGSATPATCS